MARSRYRVVRQRGRARSHPCELDGGLLGGWGMKALSEPHRTMLEQGSAISAGMIKQRGYYTEVDPKKLAELGFSDDQCRAPALVLPLHTVDGEQGGYQIRPDAPRSNEKGKPVK